MKTNELHETFFYSSYHQPTIEKIEEAISELAYKCLEDPMGAEETDNDHDFANEIALGIVDRIRYKLVNGEYPLPGDPLPN